MQQEPDAIQLRELAHSVDCFTEEEVLKLTGWSPATLKSKRKTGEGPPYIRGGRNYLYPRQALSEFLHGLTRHPRVLSAKGML